MEAYFGGKANVYGPVVTDVKAVGKRTLEWDLNDWKWDGDLFLASPLNPAPSDCRSRLLFPLGLEPGANAIVPNGSSFGSEEVNTSNENGRREIEKRRRVLDVPDEELNCEAGPLNLNLGEQVYPIAEGEVDKMEGRSVKKSKPAGTSQPVCQVEGCTFDLSYGKDYHRRHKVCEVHSKASEALVGNVIQRFCQQCSRFHALQEFDDEKRSCRRRLAGHNLRRRKVQPETSPNVSSLADEKSAGFLLISLLRILSNLHSNASDEPKDQDLISYLLRNLAGQVNGSNMPDIQRASQSLLNAAISFGMQDQIPVRAQEGSQAEPLADAQIGVLTRENQHVAQQTHPASPPNVLHPAGGSVPAKGSVQEADLTRHRLSGIDLNSVYIDSQECIDNQENGHGADACVFSPEQHLLKLSPPQTSGNLDSTSGHSSSSGCETQGCTDRIVFKLFGKDPNELPHLLRTQILDWLSHSPSDIEGYIRPGCIVLTVYLRLNKALWEELCYDMSSSLSRLLSVSDDPFWKTGWIYTRVQQQAAFICDGRVVLDTPLPFKNHQSQILSISPIAVPVAETVQLMVKGSNLSGPSSRLLCSIEGKYLVQESCSALVESTDTAAEQDEIQSLNFFCSIPNVVGRGFIEVEDYGLSGCFFPFIVAEPEICSEICMLERLFEVGTNKGIDGGCGTLNARNDALDFIHEMGWLLHRSCLSLKPGKTDLRMDLFPFERLKWLIAFSMDNDWCAVLRKLLDLLFSGTVNIVDHDSVEQALSKMTLLHIAVQRNSKPMVEFLLRYTPKKVKNTSGLEPKHPDYGTPGSFFFRPDATGSNGLTPLHIAASCLGFDNILDALLEDPGMVGIGAWENARDSTGLTPKDYAHLRGHNQYIKLFQRKINKNSSGKHVVVDICGLSDLKSKEKQSDEVLSAMLNSFYTDKLQLHPCCKLCEQKVDYGFRGAALTCRPAMLSLITIAVVCVCTALLFKSMPPVCDVFGPFRWESLKYGSM